MRELYVYYRVSAEHADAAAHCLRSFQAQLRSTHAGLQARWLKRASSAGDEATWMEIYAIDPAVAGRGIDPVLETAIEQAAAVLAPYLRSARRSEAFVACAS